MCGHDGAILRHSVVPHCYRQHFPPSQKLSRYITGLQSRGAGMRAACCIDGRLLLVYILPQVIETLLVYNLYDSCMTEDLSA